MTPTYPLVSVIIPAYNTARYLSQAVDSALAQTGCAVEVIIIDDASVDDTLAVAQRYTDPRIRVFSNAANRGPSFSRNRALDAARGDWVSVLDADDWFAPGRLARLLQVAHEKKADLVADDSYMIRDGETTPFTSQFNLARRAMPDPFILTPASFIATNKVGRECFRLGVTKPIIRKAFLDQHGIRYDENIRFCEDLRLYLQCLLHGAHFVIEPAPYYYRRKHKSSITAGDILGLLEQELHAAPALLDDPLIKQDVALVAALQDRTDDMRRHLAFRRLQNAWRSRNGRAVRSLLTYDALSFAVQRLFDRLRGSLYILYKALIQNPVTRLRKVSSRRPAEAKISPVEVYSEIENSPPLPSPE